ncbi:MAG: hypothetical protein LBQ61_08950, partial [Spirochaetales bacterium]|nr:hypothetical protein [Spirochaetales bacterium]
NQIRLVNRGIFCIRRWTRYSGRYEGLRLADTDFLQIALDGLLVKPEAVKAQIEKEKPETGTMSNNLIQGIDPSTSPGPIYKDGNLSGLEGIPPSQPKQGNKPTHFYGSVNLDINRIGQTAGTINQEVLQHFRNFAKVEIAVKMDIQIKVPDGIPDDVARTIRENCRTLKFDSNEFE